MFVYIFSISLQLTWMEWWLMLRAVCWDFCCQWESGGSETMGWETWDGLQYVSMCLCREILQQQRKIQWVRHVEVVVEWRWASWGGNQQRPDFPRPKASGRPLVSPFLYSEKEKNTTTRTPDRSQEPLCKQTGKKAKAPTWRKPQVSPVVNWREKEVQLCHVCVTTACIYTLTYFIYLSVLKMLMKTEGKNQTWLLLLTYISWAIEIVVG